MSSAKAYGSRLRSRVAFQVQHAISRRQQKLARRNDGPNQCIRQEMRARLQKREDKDRALPPQERQYLKQLKQGGKDASQALKWVDDNLGVLNAKFFDQIGERLTATGKYETARAFHLLRMKRRDFYSPRMTHQMLVMAADAADRDFADTLYLNIMDAEKSGVNQLTPKESLKLSVQFAKSTEMRAAHNMLTLHTKLVRAKDTANGFGCKTFDQDAGHTSSAEDTQALSPFPDTAALVQKRVREHRREQISRACTSALEIQTHLTRSHATSDEQNRKRPYNELIRYFGKAGSLGGVFSATDAMQAAGLTPDNETFEFIANAAVHSVEFVTSAVSMETLPSPLPEVVFVGRSNVGKSSLVNMITNRKSLAKISNTPGKTKQYNYFIVNRGSVSGSMFYFVDMPGIGFARVPGELSDRWLEFTKEYFSNRESLRLIFHLVDSKLGFMPHDEELMRMVVRTNCQSRYCLVLTKIDKIRDNKLNVKVVDTVLDAFERYGIDYATPVIPSSATTRVGRAELWRTLFASVLRRSRTSE